MKRLNFFFNLKKSKEAKMPKIRKMDISGPELANEKDVRSLIDRAPAIKEFLFLVMEKGLIWCKKENKF